MDSPLPTFADFRRAFRRWRSRPVFAIVAAGTLAIGIAATTATFSVVEGVLLRPLPWPQADELMTIWVVRPHWRSHAALASSWDRGIISWPIYTDLQTKSRAFSAVGAWDTRRPTLNGDRNEPVFGLRVSASFLPMLGVKPYLGRFFTTEEDTSPTDAVLVSYEAWQRRFGGTPDILGRQVSLDETMTRIVGVLPPGFNFTQRNAPEFTLPFGPEPAANRTAGNHFMYGLGRLRPGATIEAATQDIDPLIRGDERPEAKQARLRPLVDEQFGAARRPLWLLLWASAVLLLIACSARRPHDDKRCRCGPPSEGRLRESFVSSSARVFSWPWWVPLRAS